MNNFDIKCKYIEEELKTFWPQWHVAKHLGGGSFGDVFEIYRDNFGIRESSALKMIHISDVEETKVLFFSLQEEADIRKQDGQATIPEAFLNEIQIMESLRGAPNVVAIEDFHLKENVSSTTLFVRMELLTSFQQVMADGTAKEYGDEPLQIKNKFPMVTVAVDKSRKEGCDFLCHPETLHTSKAGRRCMHKEVKKADLIILDDAFQHRSIKASVSIVLIDFNRPLFKDHIIPLGKLRDLPERINAADIVIVTKCPGDLNAWERCRWSEALGVKMYDNHTCCGTRKNGRKQHVFFTKTSYGPALPIFPEGDARYVYSQKLTLFSGIANDTPLRHYLSSSYKIVRHLNFPDHHKFSRADIREIEKAAGGYPTSVVMTTEKDCQRIRDCRKISDNLKLRLFYTPIQSEFLSEQEDETFTLVLKAYLK